MMRTTADSGDAAVHHGNVQQLSLVEDPLVGEADTLQQVQLLKSMRAAELAGECLPRPQVGLALTVLSNPALQFDTSRHLVQ